MDLLQRGIEPSRPYSSEEEYISEDTRLLKDFNGRLGNQLISSRFSEISGSKSETRSLRSFGVGISNVIEMGSYYCV